MEVTGWDFLGLPPELKNQPSARFGVVPVPFERTTSYGQGTAGGPAAIDAASRYVELFDEEYLIEAGGLGVWNYEPICSRNETIEDSIHHIYTTAERLLQDGRFLIFTGGEHSITGPLVRAYAKIFNGLTVLQIDAHADLRDSYEGSRFSHASAMRRVLEECSAVQAGIRSISQEEYRELPSLPTCMIFAYEYFRSPVQAVNKVLEKLSDTVYITVDLDGFDPSLLPATGTPEPGGLFWNDVMTMLSRVFASKNVVGADVVELAPRRGDPASDFLAAKLVYKMMTMKAAADNRK